MSILCIPKSFDLHSADMIKTNQIVYKLSLRLDKVRSGNLKHTYIVFLASLAFCDSPFFSFRVFCTAVNGGHFGRQDECLQDFSCFDCKYTED